MTGDTPPAAALGRRRASLGSRNFVALWGSTTASNLADGLFQVGLPLNMSRLPSVTGLIPRSRLEAGRPEVPDDASISKMEGTPYGLFRVPALLSPLGLPCTKPPWGTLLAVDTASSKVQWEVPLGTVRDLAPVPLPIRWAPRASAGPS